ncbi:MAG: UDP-3-O-(3-hydroxymyristoyl)glucosamine N-acyltransferase [Nitrospiria bacterium]
MEIPLKDIAHRVNGRIVGDAALLVRGIASTESAQAEDMTFVTNRKHAKRAAASKARVVMTQAVLQNIQKTFLLVDDPYYRFAQLLSYFHPAKLYRPGIDPKASIGRNVDLGEGVSIGPHAVLEDRVRIAQGVRIGAGVFIGDGCEIGAESLIYPNVTIREGVQIGRRVIIHSGSVIGSDGFGFAPYQGKHHKIPQVGGVTIEDDVELGSNVSIDRGTLGNTRVGRGTKIDNLVQIGHNVEIGNDTILVSQVGISGSVTIGHHVTLAGQVGVSGHLAIGNHVVIGGKSGVTKDIPSGSGLSGFPPLPHKQWLKSQAAFHHLPEMRTQLKKLEKKIAKLEREMTHHNRREESS